MQKTEEKENGKRIASLESVSHMNEEVDPRVESTGAHSTASICRGPFSRSTAALDLRIATATPVTAHFGSISLVATRPGFRLIGSY